MLPDALGHMPKRSAGKNRRGCLRSSEKREERVRRRARELRNDQRTVTEAVIARHGEKVAELAPELAPEFEGRCETNGEWWGALRLSVLC